MNRDENVKFFTGCEVETTPAYGKYTLFVVGVHSIETIVKLAKSEHAEHIYLGANQSFTPCKSWHKMISGVLNEGYLTTLDFDVNHMQWVLDNGYCNNNNFIPQISVKLPNILKLNYNATLKIDDIGFNKTNPGVWCHSVHTLLDRKVFTDWNRYKEDTEI